MPFKFAPTAIPDVVVVEPQIFGDPRGFFLETWSSRDFLAGNIDADFVQENHSRSAQGVLRGLHYQIQQPQGKLIRVIAGEVFDVAVDMRKSSATFGQWVGVTLSADNKKICWIPPGFAHGFYVISPFTEFVYKCTDFYAPKHERAVLWNDPVLNITWPLIKGSVPLLSEKDSLGEAFMEADYFL